MCVDNNVPGATCDPPCLNDAEKVCPEDCLCVDPAPVINWTLVGNECVKTTMTATYGATCAALTLENTVVQVDLEECCANGIQKACCGPNDTDPPC